MGADQSSCLKIIKRMHFFFLVIPLICQEQPPTQQPDNVFLQCPARKKKKDTQEEYAYLLCYKALTLISGLQRVSRKLFCKATICPKHAIGQ